MTGHLADIICKKKRNWVIFSCLQFLYKFWKFEDVKNCGLKVLLVLICSEIFFKIWPDFSYSNVLCMRDHSAYLGKLPEQSFYRMGYWHQRADERHGNPPPR